MRKVETKTKWGRDDYLLIDAGELTVTARATSFSVSSWSGGGTREQFLSKVELGDQSLVQQSDDYLAKIEDQVPVSRGWRNVDDVVGAVPNVPAFLAGHPQCMRRRERTMRDTAPLAIYMDLTSSGGITAQVVQRRGVVLLALTRMLVEHRAVELWVGASLGGSSLRGSGTVAWQIDTAPLDLARAAHRISSTTMSRGFGYSACQQRLSTKGSWPFNSYALHVETAPSRLQTVFAGQTLLYVPPVYLTDPLVTNPVAWLKKTMAKYTEGEQ